LVVVLAPFWDRAIFEQAAEVVGMDGVPQEKRLGYVEDFLHRAQVGRVREKDGTGEGEPARIGLSVRRNNDLAD